MLVNVKMWHIRVFMHVYEEVRRQRAYNLISHALQEKNYTITDAEKWEK